VVKHSMMCSESGSRPSLGLSLEADGSGMVAPMPNGHWRVWVLCPIEQVTRASLLAVLSTLMSTSSRKPRKAKPAGRSSDRAPASPAAPARDAP
jgi:hypothetical protein